MRRQHHDDQEEAGWISLVDLLTVLVLIGGVAAVGYSRSLFVEAEAARKAQVAAEAKAGELEQFVARAEKDAGDWREVAEGAQVKNRQLQNEIDELAGDQGKSEQALRAERDKAVKERDAAKAEQASLQAQLAEARGRKAIAERLSQRMRQVIDQAGLKIPPDEDEQEVVVTDPPEAQPVDPKPPTEAQRWAQDVLKLSGSLHRTVFVMDRSQSMSRGGRWDEARETVRTYIKYLPVSHAALVVFGSDVRTIPSSLNHSRSQAPGVEELPLVTDDYRESLLRELEELAPLGETRTKRALQRAMEFKDVDTIFLFTDGTPDTSDGGGDPRESVLRLVRDWKKSNPDARVHTVGIGDYFNSSMRDFLLGIAKSTDGTFIGR
jgi:hypothetical protein